jgi:hypothetical protein
MAKPEYFSQLSEADQRSYEQLQRNLSAPTCKNRRNKSIETFISLIELIKTFVVGTDEDHWKRALVCGICWFGNSMAINTRQFMILTNKCKSSINGLFKALGYGLVPSGSDAAAPLLTFFPFMRGRYNELRQWTVRQKISPQAPLVVKAPMVEQAPFVVKAPLVVQAEVKGTTAMMTEGERYVTPPPEEDGFDGFGLECGGFGFARVVTSDEDQKGFAGVFEDPYAWGDLL